VKAALDALSPETKEAEKAADKIKKKADTEADHLKKALEHEAARLHDSLRKPEEKMKDEIDRAKELVAKGLLSAQDLGRLKDKLYEELNREPKTSRVHGESALLASG